MRKKAPSPQTKRVLIQPDSRGRIQLPQDLRNYDLYELIKGEKIHSLRGIQIPAEGNLPELDTEQPSRTRWLPEDVLEFLKTHLFPAIREFCKKQKLTQPVACCLYGSQARGDSHTNSDFDFAIFSRENFSFQQRKLFRESFELETANEKRTLEAHQILGDFSFVFINVDQKTLPPLYYSIAEDAVLIYQSDSIFKTFIKNVQTSAKKTGMKKATIASHSTWSWGKKHGSNR